MSERSEQLWNWLTGKLFWGALAFVITFVGFGYLIYSIVKSSAIWSSPLGLSILSLLGVLALLGALLVFTTVVNAIGLSNHRKALGLPEGSVRALLALALLGLFAILISSVLVKPEPHTVEGLRAEDISALLKNNPDVRDIVQVQQSTEPPTFKVTFYSPARLDDFARQMLTLVGTLMTAVISFYFGTSTTAEMPRGESSVIVSTPTSPPPRTASSSSGASSSETPAGEPSVSIPAPTSLTPRTATKGASQGYIIEGTGLAGVTRVEAAPPMAGGSPEIATDVRATAKEVKFNLTLPIAGDWTIQIASGASAPVQVTGKITVT